MFGVPKRVMEGLVMVVADHKAHNEHESQKKENNNNKNNTEQKPARTETTRRGPLRFLGRFRREPTVTRATAVTETRSTLVSNHALEACLLTGLAVLLPILAWSRRSHQRKVSDMKRKVTTLHEKSAKTLAKEEELLARQAKVEAPVDAPWVTRTTTRESHDTADADASADQSQVEEVLRDLAATIVSGFGFLKGILLGPLNYSIMDVVGLLGNLRDFVGYLLKTKIYQEEMGPVLLNARFWSNFEMLFQLQQELELEKGEERRSRAAAPAARSSFKAEASWEVSKEDAEAYMKYSTAAYGDYMMHAAALRRGGEIDKDWARANETIVSAVHTAELVAYLDLQSEQDVFLKDLEVGGSPTKVGYFAALDHSRKAVVLSIRGTFSLTEIVTDLVAMTRTPSWAQDGEALAHVKMAQLADDLWARAGDAISAMLQLYSDYKFIVTGHSLGAGVATLLTIKVALTEQDRISQPASRIRCFAFACPPVYCDKTNQRRHLYAPLIVNILHQEDMVPFLSVWSIRKFFQLMRAVDEFRTSQGIFFRLSNVLGRWGGKSLLERFPALADAYQDAKATPLRPIEGSDLLACPAAQTLWLRRVEDNDPHDDDDDEEEEAKRITASGRILVEEDDEGVAFDCKNCTPKSLTTLGVRLHVNLLLDHFPPDYEYALKHWDIEEASQWVSMRTVRRRQQRKEQNGLANGNK